MKEFDYAAAVRRVEEIIRKVEDPSTGIFESEDLIGQGRALLEECYAYLRGQREIEDKQ